MLSFRVKNIVPPGGRYFFFVPDTGIRIDDFSRSRLLDKVRAHYNENRLTLPVDLEAVVEDHMCRHLPDGFCRGDLDGKPRARVLTLQQIRESTKKLADATGRVAPGVARERAYICGRCPKNDTSLCPSCVGLVSWAQRLVSGELGGVAGWLGVCAVDGTANAAKVHMKGVPENSEYPAECWRSKENG